MICLVYLQLPICIIGDAMLYAICRFLTGLWEILFNFIICGRKLKDMMPSHGRFEVKRNIHFILELREYTHWLFAIFCFCGEPIFLKFLFTRDYMDRFLDENESAASSQAGSPGRPHIVQANVATEDGRSTAETVAVKRPSSSDVRYTNPSSSMMSGLIRIPQSYVPTPVIVSNDKEPPAKKPNLNTESLIMSNGPPPLRPHDNTTIPISHNASQATNSAITNHSTSHVTNHVMHLPSQLVTGISTTTSTSNTALPFSSLNAQHLSMHTIESGNTYARLT